MMWPVGSARIHRVTETAHWPFPPEEAFPDWTAEHAAQAARRFPEAYDTTTGELVLSIHTHVIELGNLRIVVDAGNGDHKPRPVLAAHHGFAAGQPDRLRASGFPPDSIDVVATTHLHPDHCGGNTVLRDGGWVPTFGNAQYLIVRADQHWLDRLGEPGAGTVESDLARMREDSVRPLARQIQVVDAPHPIADHDGTRVRLEPAPGHSPGHCVVTVEAPDGSGALIGGDLLHHPLQLDHPELVHVGDGDPEAAAASRRAWLGLAAERRWPVLTAHFPEGAPQLITETADGLAWVERASEDAGPSRQP